MGIPFKGGKRRKPLPGEPVHPPTSVAVRPDERRRLETRFRKQQSKWPKDAHIAWCRHRWAWVMHREAPTPLTEALFDLQPVAFVGRSIREGTEASARCAALATRIRFSTPDSRPLCFPSKERAQVEIECKIAELAAVVRNVTRTAVARDAALLSLAGLSGFHYRGPAEAASALAVLPTSASAKFCRRWLGGEAFHDPTAAFIAEVRRVLRSAPGSGADAATVSGPAAAPGAVGRGTASGASGAAPEASKVEAHWVLDVGPRETVVVRCGDATAPLVDRRKKPSNLTVRSGVVELLVAAATGEPCEVHRRGDPTQAKHAIEDVTAERVTFKLKKQTGRFVPPAVTATNALIEAVREARK